MFELQAPPENSMSNRVGCERITVMLKSIFFLFWWKGFGTHIKTTLIIFQFFIFALLATSKNQFSPYRSWRR